MLAGGLLTRLDHEISHIARQDWGLRFETWPRRGLRALTLFGQRGPVLIVALPFVAWLTWRTRRAEPILRLVAALLLLTTAVYALKLGLARDAPPHDGVRTDQGRSYPSGHLANAVLVWGLLAWLAGRYRVVSTVLARWLRAVAIAGPALVVVGMTLLDYHWMSDFIAGAALGVVLLWVVTVPIDRHGTARRAAGPAPRTLGFRPSEGP